MSYNYDDRHEAPFGKQLQEMLDYHDSPYFEIWMGTDGYAVSNPDYKVYDSEEDDFSLVESELGITQDDLDHLVIMRAGTGYLLSEATYEEKTGCEYPFDIAEKYNLPSIVVMVVSKDDALSRIHSGKFA